MTRRETTYKEKSSTACVKNLELTFKGFALLNSSAKTHFKFKTNMERPKFQ